MNKITRLLELKNKGTSIQGNIDRLRDEIMGLENELDTIDDEIEVLEEEISNEE